MYPILYLKNLQDFPFDGNTLQAIYFTYFYCLFLNILLDPRFLLGFHFFTKFSL